MRTSKPTVYFGCPVASSRRSFDTCNHFADLAPNLGETCIINTCFGFQQIYIYIHNIKCFKEHRSFASFTHGCLGVFVICNALRSKLRKINRQQSLPALHVWLSKDILVENHRLNLQGTNRCINNIEEYVYFPLIPFFQRLQRPGTFWGLKQMCCLRGWSADQLSWGRQPVPALSMSWAEVEVAALDPTPKCALAEAEGLGVWHLRSLEALKSM